MPVGEPSSVNTDSACSWLALAVVGSPSRSGEAEGVVGNGDGVAYTGSRGELPGGLLMPTRACSVVAPQSGEGCRVRSARSRVRMPGRRWRRVRQLAVVQRR